MDKQARQEKLKRGYAFDCACQVTDLLKYFSSLKLIIFQKTKIKEYINVHMIDQFNRHVLKTIQHWSVESYPEQFHQVSLKN